MNAHTPGPWRVNKYRSIGAGEHGTKPIVAHVEPFYGDDTRYGDDTANARLIAAAPELLAALNELLKFDSTAYAKGSDRANALLAAKKAAWAAIAAAEGRQP